MKQRILAVVGPTASGKTALSLALDRVLPIEIVCMDSMQIYRGMDIGTAKPTKAEQAAVPHHMLDIVHFDSEYSVAAYRRDAMAVIEGVIARGHVPVLVGGTGLYLRSLLMPLTYGQTGSDEAVRRRFELLAQTEGAEALHQRLQRVDAVTAARLHPNDVRRVVRALEVYEVTGRPFSMQVMPDKADGPYDIWIYGILWDRAALYERINRRVDAMMAMGLTDEVAALAAQGASEGMQSMQGIGYKELLPVVRGEAEQKQAVDLIKQRTRNYAKRQVTWFQKEAVTWLAPDVSAADFAMDVQKQWKEKGQG